MSKAKKKREKGGSSPRPVTASTQEPRSIATRGRLRVALYSHDALGLGHVRRNLALATAMAPLQADILLLTGAPEAAAMRRPAGVDVVGLPALAKDADGAYAARHLSLGADAVLDLRSAILHGSLASFAPDLLIVDKHPRGFRGELVDALDHLRMIGRTRMVLGLRDILDAPAQARQEWRLERGNAAVAAYYDQVWVYGDTRVHDAAAAIGLRAETRSTGYLARGRLASSQARVPSMPVRPFVLAALGGGNDGAELARAFAAAPMPEGHDGVLITGPHLPEHVRRQVRASAAARPDLHVHRYRDDLDRWYAAAAAVVSMGGYNTVCEVLAAARPLLVVPRVRPRAEQLVRAEALAAVGALDMLHPGEVDGAAIGAWAASAVGRDARPAPKVDLDGLDRIPMMAAELVGIAAQGEARSA